jgi:hypothetical protein
LEEHEFGHWPTTKVASEKAKQTKTMAERRPMKSKLIVDRFKKHSKSGK